MIYQNINMDNAEKFIPTNLVLGIHIPIECQTIVDLQRYLNVETVLELHVTLLLMPIPESEVGTVENLLPVFLETLSLPSELTSKETVTVQNGNVLLELEGKILPAIHRQLLETFNPMRNNFLRSKDVTRMISDSSFSDQERQMLENYGFAYSGDLFRPHISLGKGENLGEIASLENMLPVNLHVNGIEAMIHHEDVKRGEVYWRWRSDY